MIEPALATRRKFAHAWDEISYLYHKTLYWAYARNNYSKARVFVPRLLNLLEKDDPQCIALLGLTARALVFEIRDELEHAVVYRSKEIKTLEYLLKLGGAAAEGLDRSDVSDSMDLLASLYWNMGDLKKAQQTLEASRDYCKQHQLAFDAQDMLDDVLAERAEPQRNGKHLTTKRSKKTRVA